MASVKADFEGMRAGSNVPAAAATGAAAAGAAIPAGVLPATVLVIIIIKLPA
jgi:hypothetical protein